MGRQIQSESPQQWQAAGLVDGARSDSNNEKIIDDGPRVNDNSGFMTAVYAGQIPAGAGVVVVSFPGNPNTVPKSRWAGQPFYPGAVWPSLPATSNNYLCASSHFPDEGGKLARKKKQFAALHFIMLDDLQGKIPLDKVTLPLSWLIETSAGNYQGAYCLAEPITDAALADRLMSEFIRAGLCDPGADGPTARLARLPFAVNGKTDPAFPVRLVSFDPAVRYTAEALAEHYGFDLSGGRPARAAKASSTDSGAEDVFVPAPAENPVIAELKARGLYKGPLGNGRHDITCPWVSDHTDQVDGGTAYFEPDDGFPLGGYKCFHSHGDSLTIRDLLQFLGVSATDAKCRPTIRVQPGDLHRVADAAEKMLADSGQYFQGGGIICKIARGSATHETAVIPMSQPAVLRALCQIAVWQKYDRRREGFVVCDPPDKTAQILHCENTYARLPVLRGIARQPHLRPDGSLVCLAGYDAQTQRYGAFDASAFSIPDNPTRKDAEKALAVLQDILSEVSFNEPVDNAAAFTAMLTAAARPSLPVAPGFLVKAHQPGSGKSYLAKIISILASPVMVPGVAFPDANEMRKLLLATLSKSPAAIFFDDMESDVVPIDLLKMCLTEEFIAGRLLQVSKDVTVSTRTLMLFTGNNIEAVKDMSRRVLTISLDPKMEMPVARVFKRPNLADEVRGDRARFVSAALTIIRAWIAAGSPRAAVRPVATYGLWSDWCRQPIIWLGLPDPATRIFEQVLKDPDSELLGRLMTAWKSVWGFGPVQVRKLVSEVSPDLRDCVEEVAVYNGATDKKRLGWWLKKQAGRIVDGLRLVRVDGGGSAASWRIEAVSDCRPGASWEDI